MKSGVRKIVRHCGKYGVSSAFIQVSYFPYNTNRKKPQTRQRKYEVSTPKQRKLNNKRAKRYLEALIYSNFGKGDLRVDLTYAPENMPADEKAAKKEIQNYIKRINYRRKKLDLENARYIVVTEFGKNGKIHHHLIMDADMDRDIVESTWGKGYANTRRLQPDINMKLTAIIRYLVKDFKSEKETANKRKWDSSLNLVKPWESINDDPRMMSKKKMRLMKDLPEDCEQMKIIIEKDNPNYELMEVEKEYYEEMGTWNYFCRMKIKGEESTLSTELSTDIDEICNEKECGNGKNRRNQICRENQRTSGAKKQKPRKEDTEPP